MDTMKREEDPDAQPVDGGGLLPRAHAAAIASDVPPSVAAALTAELRHALVPVLAALRAEGPMTEQGRARAIVGVQRVMRLAEALTDRAREKT